MLISRRRFIESIGRAGGVGAAQAAILGLGLASSAHAGTAPSLFPGERTKVAILGAGMAGLVAAYELERAGYEVVVLEARDRVGGRNWTLRGGDRVVLNGEADQTASFSDGLYFNAGPARIPSNHLGVLGYAKRLGVALEVEVNSNRGALLQSQTAFGGRPIRNRQAVYDIRGAVSELLAKATQRGALDQTLTLEDKERLLAFLRSYGDLNPDYGFTGSERSGYQIPPGAYDQAGRPLARLPLAELLKDSVLPLSLYDDNILMQATMFQPVGGMDQIPAAFARAIRSPIVLGAAVERIRQSPDQTWVDYIIRETGARGALNADYLIVTLPLPILAGLDTDFSGAVKRAIAGAAYDYSAKVAFESPRFWEAEQIYGGLSFVGGETTLVWYPSGGFFSPRGVLVGAYSAGPAARRFEARPITEQITMARNAVERLHPGHGADLAGPVAVDWNKTPFSLGPWIHWDGGDNDLGAYALLNQPEGRVYFSGAHLSQLPSWQEGAILAAHRTIAELGRRARADRVVRPSPPSR